MRVAAQCSFIRPGFNVPVDEEGGPAVVEICEALRHLRAPAQPYAVLYARVGMDVVLDGAVFKVLHDNGRAPDVLLTEPKELHNAWVMQFLHDLQMQ